MQFKYLVCALIAGTISASVLAAGSGAKTLPKKKLEWKEVAPGVSFAAAYGDWEKGAHGKFVKFEPGAKVSMHSHTNGYHAVMVSGKLTSPYKGRKKARKMASGTYWFVPAGAIHSNECVSDKACVFYTNADGAWDLIPAEKPAD